MSWVELTRIDLEVISLLAKQSVESESERARDQCQRAAVTQQVNLSFLVHVSRIQTFNEGQHLIAFSLVSRHRVTWGKAPPFGDDLSLTYFFASTSEKSYI